MLERWGLTLRHVPYFLPTHENLYEPAVIVPETVVSSSCLLGKKFNTLLCVRTSKNIFRDGLTVETWKSS